MRRVFLRGALLAALAAILFGLPLSAGADLSPGPSPEQVSGFWFLVSGSSSPTSNQKPETRNPVTPKPVPAGPGRVVVKLRPGAGKDILTAALASLPPPVAAGPTPPSLGTGLQPALAVPGRGWTVREDRRQGIYRVPVMPGQELVVVQRLAATSGVEYAEPVVKVRALDVITPTDTLYLSQQWNLRQIGLPAAWATVTGTRSITIAVVDSGVKTDHPDLAAQIWRNPGEIAGNGVDDDGNGCTDDVVGCNFVTPSSPSQVENPWDVGDGYGHGTHVAGIAAAATNNALGIAGVAWNAAILPVRVLDRYGSGDTDDVADGIEYAADRGARVVNLSLGIAGSSRRLADAVAYAQARGAVVVAAMGNYATANNPTFYPAGYPGVIAVAATDSADQRAYFSSTQHYATLAAPGVSILSTVPTTAYRMFDPTGYGLASGTSMATPHVAGVAALILSRWPDLTPAQVKSLLEQSAAGGRWTQELGWGRLDATRAVATRTPTTALAGRVTRPDGQPAAGSLIQLGNARTLTDQEGWYHLPLSTTIGLTVTASAGGFASTARPVTIADGSWQHADLVLDWPGNAVTNGSFERGLEGWSVGGTPAPIVTTTTSVDGRSTAFLGYPEIPYQVGNVTPGTATLTATATLPSNPTTAPTLSFLYRLDTVDYPTTVCEYDCFTVTAGNPLSGTTQTILQTDRGTDWQQATADLGTFAGQTIVISFAVVNDINATTGVYLDRVTIGPVAPAQPPLTATLDLGTGWNAVSLPFEPPTGQTVADWIAGVNLQGGQVQEVYWWEHGAWQGGIPAFQTAAASVGRGYLLRAAGPSRWTAAGWPIEGPAPLTLDAGWNLVGVPTPVTHTASSLVGVAEGQGVGISQVVRWQFGTWVGYVDGYPFNDQPLRPAGAYFLLVGRPGLLVP